MKFDDIDHAFLFVSFESLGLNKAYLDLKNGQIYYASDFAGFDDIPENACDRDDVIEIPHKNELDLGKHLVFRFVEQSMPEHIDKVTRFFSKEGAYLRFRNLLERIDMLDQWYDFENSETEKTLRKWCEDNSIILED